MIGELFAFSINTLILFYIIAGITCIILFAISVYSAEDSLLYSTVKKKCIWIARVVLMAVLLVLVHKADDKLTDFKLKTLNECSKNNYTLYINNIETKFSQIVIEDYLSDAITINGDAKEVYITIVN